MSSGSDPAPPAVGCRGPKGLGCPLRCFPRCSPLCPSSAAPRTPWSGPHPARGSPGRAAPWRAPRASAGDPSTLTAPSSQPLHAAPRPPSPPTRGHQHSSPPPPPLPSSLEDILRRAGGRDERETEISTHPDGNQTGDLPTEPSGQVPPPPLSSSPVPQPAHPGHPWHPPASHQARRRRPAAAPAAPTSSPAWSRPAPPLGSSWACPRG